MITVSRVVADVLTSAVERKEQELARERLQEQLLQSQKLDALGTLASGVAHEMNNVLAAVLG